jgi:DNA mismatch endonuclease, patch repair protein
MSDIFTQEKRSEIMRRIHSEDTKPEVRVRKYLHKNGFRFRLHIGHLPGKPDIALKKYKMVIFVQGCFWHGHPCKIGSGNRKPKQNHEYWNTKINKNIVRDKENTDKLKKLGWEVLNIWECKSISDKSLSNILTPLFEMREKG